MKWYAFKKLYASSLSTHCREFHESSTHMNQSWSPTDPGKYRKITSKYIQPLRITRPAIAMVPAISSLTKSLIWVTNIPYRFSWLLPLSLQILAQILEWLFYNITQMLSLKLLCSKSSRNIPITHSKSPKSIQWPMRLPGCPPSSYLSLHCALPLHVNHTGLSAVL